MYVCVSSAVSVVVELFEALKVDLARVVLVTSSHDICDVLVRHWVVQVLSKHLLEVCWLDVAFFVAVKDAESCQALLIGATALVPTLVNHFLQEFEVEASATIVLIVDFGQLLLLLPL